jgi:hypothetical protein
MGGLVVLARGFFADRVCAPSLSRRNPTVASVAGDRVGSGGGVDRVVRIAGILRPAR